MRNACKISVGKHEEEGSLGIPRRRWEYNIRMDLRELDYCGCKGILQVGILNIQVVSYLVGIVDMWRGNVMDFFPFVIL
jgi:hypothetical protein